MAYVCSLHGTYGESSHVFYYIILYINNTINFVKIFKFLDLIDCYETEIDITWSLYVIISASKYIWFDPPPVGRVTPAKR